MEGEIKKISIDGKVQVLSFRTDQVACVEMSNIRKHLWAKQRTSHIDQEQRHIKQDIVKVEGCLPLILNGKLFKEVERHEEGDVSSFKSFEEEKHDDGGEVSSFGSYEEEDASRHSDDKEDTCSVQSCGTSSSEESSEEKATAVFELKDIPVGSCVMVRDGYKAVNTHHAKIMSHVPPRKVEIQWLGRGDWALVSIAKVREKIADDTKGRRTRRKTRRLVEEQDERCNVKKAQDFLFTIVGQGKDAAPKKLTKHSAHRNKRARV
jgi:hypothetical protein